MALQSAKRFGLEVEGDLELESRLRRMEVAIAALQPANQDAIETSRGSGVVPQVTGLSLDGTIPGGFTVKWNATTIPDLRRYELQFATDLAFANDLQTFSVAAISFPFTTATEANLVFFARVRAQNKAGQTGPYSVTLNTSTGQAETTDIADNAVTDVKIETTAIASGRVVGFLSGLIVSNNSSDAEHDIDITSGVARDFADSFSMTSSSTFTKRIDATWASGTGNGGLADTVSLVADKWYHLFMITDSDGSNVDFGFDTSLTAAALLADSGRTLFRRIFSVFTDSSANIIKFLHIGDEVTWDVLVSEWDTTSPSTSRITETIQVPLGFKLMARVTVTLAENSGGNRMVIVTDPDATDTVPSAPQAHLRVNPDDTDNDNDSAQLLIPTNTLSQISYRINAGGVNTTVKGMTQGYLDRRGQDGGV